MRSWLLGGIGRKQWRTGAVCSVHLVLKDDSKASLGNLLGGPGYS